MDWRLVLENPHFGWPDAVVADATRLRDADRRHSAGDRDMKDPLAAIEALVAPDASYHSHGIHGGQIRIPMASHSDAIRVMREARAALEVMRFGWQSAPEADLTPEQVSGAMPPSPGQIVGHNSGPDTGADVGLEVGLYPGASIYIGQVADKTLGEGVVQRSPKPWWIFFRDVGAREFWPIGQAVEDRQLADRFLRNIRIGIRAAQVRGGFATSDAEARWIADTEAGVYDTDMPSSVDWGNIARANSDDNGMMGMGPVPPEALSPAPPAWRHTLHVPGVQPVSIETDTCESPFGEEGVDYDAEGVVHSARILPRFATVAAAVAAEEPLRAFLKAARNDPATARADTAERILAMLTEIEVLVDGAAPTTEASHGE